MSALSRLASGLMGLLLPRTCACCGQTLNDCETGVCRQCLDTLPSTGFEHLRHNPMLERMEGRVRLERAMGAYYFRKGERVREIIHSFKYSGNADAAIGLGHELGRKALSGDFASQFDMAVPVPLTPSKMLTRGYNQAELIARGYCEVTGTECRTDVLERKSNKGSQTHLGNAERYSNVKLDFALGAGSNFAKGCRIVLVDDVFTTGATSEVCLRILSQIEGVRLGLLTIGYVHN